MHLGLRLSAEKGSHLAKVGPKCPPYLRTPHAKPCLPQATEGELRFRPDTEVVALKLAEAVVRKEDLQELSAGGERRICRVLQGGLAHAPDILSSIDGVIEIPVALRETSRYRLVDVYPSGGWLLRVTP